MSYYPQGMPPGPAGPPRRNPLAIASLATGVGAVLTSFCCGVFALPLSIVAVVLGFIGRGRINNSGGAETGSGMALAGIICGIVSIVLAVGLLVAALAMGSYDFSTYNDI